MNNEQELIDAGFVLTPNIFHGGKGIGRVYGRSFENIAPFDEKNVEGGRHYDYFSVDVDGTVASFNPNVSIAVEPEAQAPVTETSTAEPVEVEPIATPEVTTEAQNTAPEAQAE